MLASMWRKKNTLPFFGGISNCYNHSRNQFVVFSINCTQCYQRIQQYHSWAYTQKVFQLVIRTMLHYVPSSLIHNSQKLERTQMSFKRGMGTENVIHLHNVLLLSYSKHDFMKFLGKWMNLEIIILREISQPQKNTHSIHSLLSGYQTKSSVHPRYNSQNT